MALSRSIILQALAENGIQGLEGLMGAIQSVADTTYRYYGWGVRRKRRRCKFAEEKPLVFTRKQLISLLAKLKRDNLIKGPNSSLEITKLGEEYISGNMVIPPIRVYALEKKEKGTLVIFDIPERLRLQRAWLRDQLSVMDFKLLQKSVWIGDGILPRQFLEDANSAQIGKFIHILEIVKEGSLLPMETNVAYGSQEREGGQRGQIANA